MFVSCLLAMLTTQLHIAPVLQQLQQQQHSFPLLSSSRRSDPLADAGTAVVTKTFLANILATEVPAEMTAEQVREDKFAAVTQKMDADERYTAALLHVGLMMCSCVRDSWGLLVVSPRRE